MKYRVLFSEAAAVDLEQWFDFALHHELDSEVGDLGVPDRAVEAISDAMADLGGTVEIRTMFAGFQKYLYADERHSPQN
jgi:hypothetical protein